MRKRNFMRRALAIIACVAMCAGCSSTKSTSTTETNAKQEATESTKKDTLIYAGEAEDSINPILSAHDELATIIFSGL